MKVTFRWTIGGQSLTDYSMEVLIHAIDQIQELYPDQNYIVCYNNLQAKRIKQLENLDVKLLDQQEKGCRYDRLTLLGGPYKTEWLLWPGRVAMGTHEISMDNDVVMFKRHPIIKQFLESDKLFVASESRGHRFYGHLKPHVPEGGKSVNCGLYGVPPNFEVTKYYRKLINKYNLQGYHHMNPQGMVAHMVKSHKHKIVPNKDLVISDSTLVKDLAKRLPEMYGLHFVGINRGKKKIWEKYKELKGL